MPEVHQADESRNDLAIPEASLHPFELIQRVATNRSVRQIMNTFRSLLEILKPHPNVEPVQDVFGLRCQPTMKCTQAGIAVAENR
jgi:hypothetical protein